MSEKLVVRKLTPKPSIVERATYMIKREEQPEQSIVSELTVDRPLRFAILGRRKVAGYNDVREVNSAIDKLRASLAENASQFEVVVENSKGKQTKLRGWERAANINRSQQVATMKKVEERHIDAVTRAVHAQHQKETEELIRAGDRVKVNRRANVLAAMMLSTAETNLQSWLKPGTRPEVLQQRLFGIFSRIEDGVGDPLNVFHGIGEQAADQIKRVQEGPYRALVNLFLAAHPKLNEGVAATLNVNKFTSRDTLRSKAAVAAYTAHYEELTTNKGGKFWSLVWPSPAQFEVAVDSHMNFVDKAGVAYVHSVLATPTQSRDRLSYQNDIATATVKALDSVPLDNKLTNAVEEAIANLSGRMNQITGGKLSGVPAAVNKVMEFAGLKPKSVKNNSGEQTEEEKLLTTAKQTRKDTEARLKAPMSIIDYHRTMLNLADTMINLPDLTPAEKVKWQQAVRWGEYVLGTYQMAKNITDQRLSTVS